MGRSQVGYSPNQAEVYFRAAKGMSLVKNQDSMAFKNYFNAHKDELHREIDSLNKLSGLKEKLLTSLAVDIQQSLTTLD